MSYRQQSADGRRRPANRPQLFDQDGGHDDSPPQSAAHARRQLARPPQRVQNRRPIQAAPPPRSRTRPEPSRRSAPQRRPQTALRPDRQSAQRRPQMAKAAPPRRKKKKGARAALAIMLMVAVLGTGVFALFNIYGNRVDGTQTDAGVLPEEGMTLPEFKGDHVSFLVCGLDYDEEGATSYSSSEKVGHTDMILYAYFNIKENKLSLMQIPRDTYVGDTLNTGGTGKINGLYYCATDKNNRMAALSTALNDQFKLPVDFYITIDLDALKALVDVKGSIEVYIPMDIEDPESSSRLEEGWRHLEGDQLEFFLRNRNNPGYNQQADVARLRMQQSFYSALYREFTQLTPQDLMMWMNVLTYYVKTDEDILSLSGIALKALDLQGSDITFVRPACGSVSHNGHSLLSLVEDDMVQILNEYFRPEGQSYSAAELNMYTLPISDSVGIAPAEIKSMADIQQTEPEQPA